MTKFAIQRSSAISRIHIFQRFRGDPCQIFDDPDHSEEEERFILLGFSHRANLLVVCHCYRQSESVIRIISARRATKNEEKAYNG